MYQRSTAHVWVIEADGRIVRDYAVAGRHGWPLVGTYQVYAKAASDAVGGYGVTYDWVVSFAHRGATEISFHDVPRSTSTGVVVASEVGLDSPVRHGGWIRQRDVDAQWLYGWAAIGTTVVVVQ